MPRKLAIVAVTGIATCIVCLGAAAVIDAPRLRGVDWERFARNFDGFDSCEAVPGATATRRELEWNGGNEIRIGVPGKVHYRRGEGDKVIVTGDPRIIAHVKVEGERVRLDCGGNNGGRIDVTLPGQEFRRFSVAGAADLDAEGLDQTSVEIRISGAGNIRASGTVQDAKVRISGSGDAHLGELAVKDIDLKISGAGSGEIAPQENAKLEVSGAGRITLLTDPKMLDTHVSGAGRIVHRSGATDER